MTRAAKLRIARQGLLLVCLAHDRLGPLRTPPDSDVLRLVHRVLRLVAPAACSGAAYAAQMEEEQVAHESRAVLAVSLWERAEHDSHGRFGDVEVGDEGALGSRGKITFRPILRGIVQDWDCMAKLWQ